MVYTRQPTVPKQYIPRIKEAFARANVDWDKFILTDNSCKCVPRNHPPPMPHSAASHSLTHSLASDRVVPPPHDPCHTSIM